MLSSYFSGSPTPSRTPVSTVSPTTSRTPTSTGSPTASHTLVSTGSPTATSTPVSSIKSKLGNLLLKPQVAAPPSYPPSLCTTRRCHHPAARNMVECQNCGQWDHCLCAGIKHAKAKKTGFVYTCVECKKEELNCLPALYFNSIMIMFFQ